MLFKRFADDEVTVNVKQFMNFDIAYHTRMADKPHNNLAPLKWIVITCYLLCFTSKVVVFTSRDCQRNIFILSSVGYIALPNAYFTSKKQNYVLKSTIFCCNRVTFEKCTFTIRDHFVLFLSIWMPINLRQRFLLPFNTFLFHQKWTLFDFLEDSPLS